MNGQLVRRTRPDVPKGFPDFAVSIVEAQGSLDPFEIWISQHRLNDSSDQIYLRSMGNEALRRGIVDFAKGA
ncbi:hypothetical protein NL526_30445, partial [Klebsiella pneumoniae]|nr:hypothetical protein [Klebsiella pneumoniae]